MRSRRSLSAALITALLVVVAMLASGPAYAAAPTITSFTPTSGPMDTVVTINGTNFVAGATVTFGGVPSTSVAFVSAAKLTARVPATAPSGPIKVTTTGGSATSTTSFTVTSGATVAPLAGPPTTKTTFSASGFAASEAVDVYFDSNEVALVVTSSTGSLSTSVQVPSYTPPGAHWITAVGRRSGAAAQAAFTVRTDSPQYGYTATRRGTSPFENQIDYVGGAASLQEQWTVSGHGSVLSTPAVVAGYVYTGWGDGTVASYSESTGAQRWSVSTGGEIISSPAVVNSTVYVGSEDGYVYALNATTGATKWRYHTDNEVRSSPAVVGNTVYVSSDDGKVYALVASTGALLWSFDLGYSTFSSPAVANGVVYACSPAGTVYALSAATGAQIWSYTLLSGGILSSPTVANGTVYIGGSDGTMAALRASSGSPRWSYGAAAQSLGPAAVAGGQVYFGDSSGNAYALNATTGAVIWTTSTAFDPLTGAVTVAGGVAYFSGNDSTLAVSTSSGSYTAALPVGSYYGYDVILDGTLTVGDYQSGSLVHYALPSASNSAVARPSIRSLRPTLTKVTG